MPTPVKTCRRSAGIALLALVCLAGCDNFAQRRFLRKESVAEGPPTPAPALYIATPPATSLAQATPPNIKQAEFVPLREAPETQNPLRALHERAVQRYATMDSYIFRLKRREVAGGRSQPEELIRIQLRREPFSVALKWLGTENKGREVIYVRGKYDNKMQIHMPAGDPLTLLMGRRLSISPDDTMARARSRHPITETGFGTAIDSFGRIVAALEKNDPREGTAKYLGQVKRPEFPQPVEAVHQVLRTDTDPLLPKGGQRWWFFDPANSLPVLIVTHNEKDAEVEYYCHDLIQCPVHLDDADFDPDRLWRK